MYNPIHFPGLGLELDPSPVAFSLFGRDIYWYGIIIAVGFLLAAVYAVRRAPQVGIKKDDLMDALLFAVPISIIFARLYYVVFNLDEFRATAENPNPQKFYEIWKGGVAIYGAIIGAVLTAWIFCRVRKIRFTAMMDVASLGLLIGQCVGRWGNFINREAYGAQTSVPWRMEMHVGYIGKEFIGDRVAVHPTFLYESLWTLLGFLVLHRFLKKRKFSGQIFLMYVAWYGLGRGVIEGLRADSLYFFGTGLRVSQFVGFLSFLVAAGLLVYNLLFREHDPASPAALAEEPPIRPTPVGAVSAVEFDETECIPYNENAPFAPSDEAEEPPPKEADPFETSDIPDSAPEVETDKNDESGGDAL